MTSTRENIDNNETKGTRMRNSAIEINELTKQFGTVHAVDGVNWSGGHGVIGVLGPNGAGKTTLLRILATVLSPDSGGVRLLGLDPATRRDRVEIRRRLGYLPQHTGLYPSFSAFDLVDYVAVLKEITDRDQRRDAVRSALEDVGLSDDMHRRIRTLSGGTKRRVALAAALVGQPELLVLDEPAAGLDPDQRLRLREVLSRAGRTGTVVVSTHQTDEVSAFCQQVLVIHAGLLRFAGTPHDLAALADGRVWIDDHAHPQAVRSWVTADNQTRNIGSPPAGAELTDPTIDDGYLILTTGTTS